MAWAVRRIMGGRPDKRLGNGPGWRGAKLEGWELMRYRLINIDAGGPKLVKNKHMAETSQTISARRYDPHALVFSEFGAQKARSVREAPPTHNRRPRGRVERDHGTRSYRLDILNANN